jgi:hypothetical protein
MKQLHHETVRQFNMLDSLAYAQRNVLVWQHLGSTGNCRRAYHHDDCDHLSSRVTARYFF